MVLHVSISWVRRRVEVDAIYGGCLASRCFIHQRDIFSGTTRGSKHVIRCSEIGEGQIHRAFKASSDALGACLVISHELVYGC